METVGTSETSVYFNETTLAESSRLDIRRCENLKGHTKFLISGIIMNYWNMGFQVLTAVKILFVVFWLGRHVDLWVVTNASDVPTTQSPANKYRESSAARAWGWPLTPILCRGQEWVGATFSLPLGACMTRSRTTLPFLISQNSFLLSKHLLFLSFIWSFRLWWF
jgi:hypothetical protein